MNRYYSLDDMMKALAKDETMTEMQLVIESPSWHIKEGDTTTIYDSIGLNLLCSFSKEDDGDWSCSYECSEHDIYGMTLIPKTEIIPQFIEMICLKYNERCGLCLHPNYYKFLHCEFDPQKGTMKIVDEPDSTTTTHLDLRSKKGHVIMTLNRTISLNNRDTIITGYSFVLPNKNETFGIYDENLSVKCLSTAWNTFGNVKIDELDYDGKPFAVLDDSSTLVFKARPSDYCDRINLVLKACQQE